MEPPSEDYDDLTVDEVIQRVDDGEFDPVDTLDYEMENKNRVTLIRWLDNFMSDWLRHHGGIVVAPVKTRRVATFWVDPEDLYRPMHVDHTPKVEEAIEAGHLQVLNR